MLNKEQEETKDLLEESAEIKKELSKRQMNNLASSDIAKVLRGIGSLAFVVLMLVFVVKKIANITNVSTSGWIGLGVSLCIVTLMGVALSNILEKKTNLNENTCMNLSILIAFTVFAGFVYLLWDSVSNFF